MAVDSRWKLMEFEFSPVVVVVVVVVWVVLPPARLKF